jgi:hypothetical protein
MELWMPDNKRPTSPSPAVTLPGFLLYPSSTAAAGIHSTLAMRQNPNYRCLTEKQRNFNGKVWHYSHRKWQGRIESNRLRVIAVTASSKNNEPNGKPKPHSSRRRRRHCPFLHHHRRHNQNRMTFARKEFDACAHN